MEEEEKYSLKYLNFEKKKNAPSSNLTLKKKQSLENFTVSVPVSASSLCTPRQ